METSVAVPSRTEVVERSLAELSDEDIEHLAGAMSRAWVRSNRLGYLAVVIPFGGCTALLSSGTPDLVQAGLIFGSLGLFAGVFVQAIASALFRRSLALEVESLGYSTDVGRETGAAWIRAIRSFLPRITRTQKHEACRKQLTRGRNRAALTGLREQVVRSAPR